MTRREEILDYIESYWDNITFNPNDRRVTTFRNALLRLLDIHLPNASVAPNHKYFARTQYYWDAYFINRGLLRSDRVELAKGIVENFAFLYKKLHIMPARNTHFSRGRTQPPFYSSMVRDVYEYTQDRQWLSDHMRIAVKEYDMVWNTNRRQVETLGLNRYNPRYFPSITGVYESGWDVSSRFALRANQVVPIDLNSLLVKYESDFIWWSELIDDQVAAATWTERRTARVDAINSHLWDEDAGFYFDFELSENAQSPLQTLAGFFPLYSGVASEDQAKRVVQHLGVFEHSGGLVMSEKRPPSIRQWDYPNCWSNILLLVVQGLLQYGYQEEAQRISQNFMDLQEELFANTGRLWEKYDVVNGRVGRPGRYLTQPGFGWTNAAYLELDTLLR